MDKGFGANYLSLMDVEGLSLKELKQFSRDERDALLAFGRPLTFRIGSAIILAEFNRSGSVLAVNLAHIDGGGEGVLLWLWKAVETHARDNGYGAIRWHIHALTCAKPNPRLQRFLRMHGFEEADHDTYGRIFALSQTL